MTGARPAAGLAALLARVVDYAGLFPPAGLPMADAVAGYARYRAGRDAWMLGRFVVPAVRLAEFEAAAGALLPGAGGAPWQLSALVGPGVAADARVVAEFNARCAGRAVVDAVELRASSAAEVRDAAAALAAGLPSGVDAYVEVPLDPDPAPLLAAVAAAGLRAKARTGGLTAAAFPSSASLARFLAVCAAARLPLKATAGLHHPVRAEYRLTYEDGAPRGTMYGFVNVFVAAALARAGASSGTVLGVLEERDPGAFAFDDAGAGWRDARLDLADLRAGREHAAAFGSCSFEEPAADLRALGWL